MEEADAILMERVVTADRSAMRILFSRHHLAVYRFVLQRVQDRTAAEDVTSAVFLDVWRNAGRFEGRSDVLTWILAIARHKSLAARAMSPLPFDLGAGNPDTPLQADRSTTLHNCLTRLPPEHREVIDLVYCQEQSMESIAAILGIPRSTVKNRVLSARKQLAHELIKSGADGVAR